MKLGSENINVFLDKNTLFEGKMTFEGIFHLDGKVEGEIFNSGTLIMGETGIVKGRLVVNSLILNGKVEGEVNAKERVEIHSKGKIYGTLFAPILVIQDGGILEGDCKMVRKSDDEGNLEGVRINLKSDPKI
jgi:cytoskeletal protein CcmA (bactofilin family)